MMGTAVTRQAKHATSTVAVAVGLLLAGCANDGSRVMRLPWQTVPPPPNTATVTPASEFEPAPVTSTEIAAASLDPINAPAPGTAPATQATMADAMLVPAPSAGPVGDSSQRVPLGTLAPATPAANAPVSLTAPPAAQVAQAEMPAAPMAPAAKGPTAAVKPAPVPSLSRDQFRSSIISPPGPPSTSPVLRPPPGSALSPEPEETQPTVVISSVTPLPPREAREFVPASIVAGQLLQPNLVIGEVPLTGAERNVVQRFETLRRLLDESLITQDEYNRRRNANIGALLPYTKPPGGIALERSVPGSDAVIARLAALRRAFEMRAISATQHALERNMILNAMLPEMPDDRADQKPPPADVIEGAAMVGHLEDFRTKNLISAAEFNAERDAIEYALKTGLLPSQDIAAKKPTTAKAGTAAAKPIPAKAGTGAAGAAMEDPMTAEITGPVLHLASFRTEEAARRAWTEATGRNKAAFASLKPIIRRVDLGPQGIFFRLMAGTFPSLSAAEATCIQLKQNNQFCRASADGT